MNLISKYFDLDNNRTNVRTEIIAGMTTFVSAFHLFHYQWDHLGFSELDHLKTHCWQIQGDISHAYRD